MGDPLDDIHTSGPTPVPHPTDDVPKPGEPGGPQRGLTHEEFLEKLRELKEDAERGDRLRREAGNTAEARGIQGFRDKKGEWHLGGGTEGGTQGTELHDRGNAASEGFEWGGTVDGAANAIGRYRGLSDDAGKRKALESDYSKAFEARRQSTGAAASQKDAHSRYAEIAAGGGPTAAQAQFQGTLDQALAAQMGSAGGGRDPMGRVPRDAMGGLGAAAVAAGTIRSGEQQLGLSGQAGMATNLRTGDMALAANDVAQAQDVARLKLANIIANDKLSLGYEGLAAGVQKEQLQNQIGKEEIIRDYEGLKMTEESKKAEAAAIEEQKVIQGIGVGFSAAATVLGIATWLGNLLSDERLKSGVKDGSSGVREAFATLSPKEYEYKTESGLPGGRHAGIIAQDLQKSRLGREAVVDIGGKKHIDIARGLGLALAGVADIQKRLDKTDRK